MSDGCGQCPSVCVGLENTKSTELNSDNYLNVKILVKCTSKNYGERLATYTRTSTSN
jgi:hypothetical protein